MSVLTEDKTASGTGCFVVLYFAFYCYSSCFCPFVVNMSDNEKKINKIIQELQDHNSLYNKFSFRKVSLICP